MSGDPILSSPTGCSPAREEPRRTGRRFAPEMKPGALLILVLLAGCGQFPKDPDGTLNRVRAEHVFRVGIVAPGPGPGTLGRQQTQAFLAGISAATGAKPSVSTGASEPLLAKLEDGKLDLVVGALDPASPWVKRVAMIPPLHERVSLGEHYLLTPMAKNGENAWIMLLEREAREAVAEGAGA